MADPIPPSSPFARTLVSPRPAEYFNFAIAQAGEANDYIQALSALAEGFASIQIEVPDFGSITDSPLLDFAEKPTFTEALWVEPTSPSPFNLTLDVEGILPAAFDDNPPELIFGSVPTFEETAPDAPPVDTNFAYPDDLVVPLPAPPSLLSLSITPFDGISMPTIDTNVPELSVSAPSIREYVPDTMYTSSLLSILQANLQDRIQNGGTALPPDIENALWDRGREREYRQMQNAIDELERMETLGYAFPPGVYVDARLKIQNEGSYNMANLSREIMIKQAELEQANILKAHDSAVQLESQLMNYSNQVAQRTFESVRYYTQSGIEIYNGRVRAYAAYLDAYKTKVAIYEAQVRAEVAKVDAYKAQIQAEEAKAQINAALVSQYKTQADVALSRIEIYKAQIAAIQTKAQIEKLKIDIFGEQVRAYATKAQAFSARVEGFRAQIQGEVAKQDAFKSKVQTYTAQVEAATRVIQARIEAYRGQVQAKTAEWDGYKAQVSSQAERVRGISTINQSLADVYRAESAALSSYNEVLIKKWQGSIELATKQAEVSIAASKANADLATQSRALLVDSGKVTAQVAAQLGAAALNAINFGESYNNSSAWNESTSFQYSQITSTQTSESNNTNINISI